jgi:triosephosphate isomerase
MIKNLMAANWKMYKTAEQARNSARSLIKMLADKDLSDREVLIFPPFTAIAPVVEAFSDNVAFKVGGQNFHPADEGAFTGEIAPVMLLDLGCRWALAGHSERRHIFSETDEYIGQKMAFGLKVGLKMILCIGETIEERRAGQVETVLEKQLEQGLSGVDRNTAAAQLAIAYEPVWAIGTGEVAGPQEIVHAHEFTRQKLAAMFGDWADQIAILYGGSVKPDSASDIMALANVNGVLVGGASLDANSFSRIVTA